MSYSKPSLLICFTFWDYCFYLPTVYIYSCSREKYCFWNGLLVLIASLVHIGNFLNFCLGHHTNRVNELPLHLVYGERRYDLLLSGDLWNSNNDKSCHMHRLIVVKKNVKIYSMVILKFDVKLRVAFLFVCSI